MLGYFLLFFFNDTATTEIYTLSLHDALPISGGVGGRHLEPEDLAQQAGRGVAVKAALAIVHRRRSEEHTSELQSRQYLVCRLLLEKKKTVQTQLEDGNTTLHYESLSYCETS